ncbi:S41 family peptidase [Compostibacter hankyongensis]|uniref:PDZ domain-containing protein n=1 Tax=Compostibacter hankyongensis TaxID=1007089 RepID=A0ABP8FCE5_9BACT
MKRLLYLSLVLLTAWTACKKDDHVKPDPVDRGNGELTAQDEDSLKFYVWWDMLSDSENVPFYYWNDQVPAVDPKDSRYDSAEDLLDDIASYPEVNGEKVDRYSFLDRVGSVSDELDGGQGGDMGFMVAGAQTPDNQTVLVVLYVYAGSPAGKAGVQRGWEVTAINGADIDLSSDAGYDAVNSALFSDASATFTFVPSSGTSKNVKLSRASYHINPVLEDTVYTVAGKKVGYFVYNSFINVLGSEGNAAVAKEEISNAFAKFKSDGVRDLIVDLRYNGGGAVPSAEYLDNLIAPSAVNGENMYSYKYNKELTAAFNSDAEYKKEYIDPVKFSLASGNLNLDRVFFIVSSNTASASELTINNLKPYMDVYLVGDQTFGKPVGFFTTPIWFVKEGDTEPSEVADLYDINFETVNAQEKGGYYSGMTPDNKLVDYVGYNWGDTEDPRLESIFSFISGKGFIDQDTFDSGARKQAFGRQAARPAMLRRSPGSRMLGKPGFNGMVDYRFRDKKPSFRR